MYNDFETLKKRCKKYRFKKTMKLVLAILLIPLLVGVYFYFQEALTPLREIQQPIKIVKKKIEKEVKKKPDKKIEIKKIVALPKMEKPKEEKIVKDLFYSLDIDKSYIKEIKSPKTAPKPILKKAVPKPKIVTQVKSVKKKEIQKSPRVTISVEKLDSIKKMISKYKREKKYSLALSIAEAYYAKEDYHNTSLWTKKANILDRRADGAWVLYAKSEYAKNNKKRAIEILRLYLANTNSKEGESQLLSWTHGK